MHDIKVFLVWVAIFVVYVLICLAVPMPKCWRCRGKRVLVPPPKKGARKPRKAKRCWYCNGRGHAPLPGGRMIHRNFHRVMRDRIRARQKADVERRLTKIGRDDGSQ